MTYPVPALSVCVSQKRVTRAAGMARQQDPYYEIRPVLESAVSKIATEISHQDPPPANGAALLARVLRLHATNNQLRSSIQLASQRRDDPRYKHIDGEEIASRTRFVDSTKKRLDDLEAYLNGVTGATKGSPSAATDGMNDGEGGVAAGGGGAKRSPFPPVGQRRPSREQARDMEEKQSLLIARQNEDVDYIAVRVGEMHEHAAAIGAEVDEQLMYVQRAVVFAFYHRSDPLFSFQGLGQRCIVVRRRRRRRYHSCNCFCDHSASLDVSLLAPLARFSSPQDNEADVHEHGQAAANVRAGEPQDRRVRADRRQLRRQGHRLPLGHRCGTPRAADFRVGDESGADLKRIHAPARTEPLGQMRMHPAKSLGVLLLLLLLLHLLLNAVIVLIYKPCFCWRLPPRLFNIRVDQRQLR